MPRRAMGDSKHGTSGERVALEKLGKTNEWLHDTTSGWKFTILDAKEPMGRKGLYRTAAFCANAVTYQAALLRCTTVMCADRSRHACSVLPNDQTCLPTLLVPASVPSHER